MNLIQIADRLKNVPLSTLAQYKSGSNPDVPPYMAVAEMQRRDTMMKQYQNAQAKPPQDTVADEVEGKLNTKNMPQQGIAAGMPQAAPQTAPPGQGIAPPQMPQGVTPTQMASGGIAQNRQAQQELMAQLQQALQQASQQAPQQQVQVPPAQPIQAMPMNAYASMASGTMPSGPLATNPAINQDLTLEQIQQQGSNLPIVAAHGGLMHHVPDHMYRFAPGGIIAFNRGDEVPDFQDPNATASDNGKSAVSSVGDFLSGMAGGIGRSIGLGEGLKIDPAAIIAAQKAKEAPPGPSLGAPDVPSGNNPANFPGRGSPQIAVPQDNTGVAPAAQPAPTPPAPKAPVPQKAQAQPEQPTGIATQLPKPSNQISKVAEEAMMEGIKMKKAEDAVDEIINLKKKLGITGEAGDALIEQAMEAHKQYQKADHSMERLQKILAAQAYGGFRAVGAADVDYQDKQRMADQAESEKYLDRIMQAKTANRAEKMSVLTKGLEDTKEHNKNASSLGQNYLKNQQEAEDKSATLAEQKRSNDLQNNYRMGELEVSKKRLANELANRGYNDKEIIAKLQADAKDQGKPISFTEAFQALASAKSGVGLERNEINRINDAIRNEISTLDKTTNPEEQKKIAARIEVLNQQLLNTGKNQTATPAIPTMAEFVLKAKPYNPTMTEAQLIERYKQLYPNGR